MELCADEEGVATPLHIPAGRQRTPEAVDSLAGKPDAAAATANHLEVDTAAANQGWVPDS